MLIKKPSFITDYVHTFIILIICIFFVIKPFTIPEIGSLSSLYDLVAAAGVRNPVSGNHDGTYLTMTSKGASLADSSWRLYRRWLIRLIFSGHTVWYRSYLW